MVQEELASDRGLQSDAGDTVEARQPFGVRPGGGLKGERLRCAGKHPRDEAGGHVANEMLLKRAPFGKSPGSADEIIATVGGERVSTEVRGGCQRQGIEVLHSQPEFSVKDSSEKENSSAGG